MYSNLISGYVTPKNYAQGRKGEEIKGFTIHHMAGNMLAKNCATWLGMENAPVRSANYYIGSDGDIWGGVPEEDTSYCSSNQVNDRSVITIEVANDGDASENWHVSEKAITSLIKLMIDICIRYNITECKWLGDPAYIGDWDIQNITIHRWFSNTGCPGAYLESQIPAICARVNKNIKYNSTLRVLSMEEKDKIIETLEYLIFKLREEK